MNFHGSHYHYIKDLLVSSWRSCLSTHTRASFNIYPCDIVWVSLGFCQSLICKTSIRELNEEQFIATLVIDGVQRLSLSTCSLGCLYPGNAINAIRTSLFDNYSYEYARLPLGFYITHELESDDDDDNYASLGLGDFLIYNWTVLFILPPFVSIEEKTLVLIGHIISVQMGCWTTCCLKRYWEVNMLPGVPCPVVFVSLYALVVDHFYGIL
jgi:hypothetical protein